MSPDEVGQLYATTHPALCSYFGARLAPTYRHMAEDMASDVFVRALMAAPTYQDRGIAPKAWVFAIARNLLTDHGRAATKWPASSLDGGMLHPPDIGAERAYRNVEDRVVVADLLDAITPEQRVAVALRFWDGLSSTEIGTALRTTDNTVKQRQKRALARMRGIMDQQEAA